MLPPGAVLFSSRAPIGLVAIAGIPVCTNQGFKSFIPGPDVDTGYLFWCLRREAPRIANRGSGSTFAEVSKEVISRFEIPLPPLAEQRRIAAVLDRADALRRKRRESLRLLDEFLRSAFLEMFGDPVKRPSTKVPEGWDLLTVQEIQAGVENACAGGPFGSSLTRSDYVLEPGVPVIRGNNLVADVGVFVDEAFAYVTEAKAAELARNIALPGDVVFTQRGTIGQVARIPIDARYPRYLVSQSQMKLTVNHGLIDSMYLVHYFLSPRARAELASRTLATGVPHINLGILKSFSVVVPPLPLQKRFVVLLSRQAAAKERLQAADSEASLLFDSLAQRAFRGEL